MDFGCESPLIARCRAFLLCVLVAIGEEPEAETTRSGKLGGRRLLEGSHQSLSSGNNELLI